VYWDASALASTLLEDAHTDQARRWARRPGLHLLSTLAHAEICAVVGRARREDRLTDAQSARVLGALDTGPWSRLEVGPDPATVRRLAEEHPLRGADLWHVAAALAVRDEIPEIVLLTFDDRMRRAVRATGLHPA
jgi:predicted nucleic acid-binding protein